MNTTHDKANDYGRNCGFVNYLALFDFLSYEKWLHRESIITQITTLSARCISQSKEVGDLWHSSKIIHPRYRG